MGSVTIRRTPSLTDHGNPAPAYDFYKAATGGSDENPGTLTEPFATWSRCWAEGSGVSIGVLNGTHSDAVGTIPASNVVQAVNDGQVIITATFSPGDNGFTMRGIRVVNTEEKNLGAGNLFERMSLVGGPACGNAVNTIALAGTTLRNSAIFGEGGRYCFLAYQVSGVTLENVIIRPDGGWGEGSSACSEFEPCAALNFYDSPGCTATGVILIDGIYTAVESERLGGLGVNCHQDQSGQDPDVFQRCISVGSTDGFFWSGGLGTTPDVNIIDCAHGDSEDPYATGACNRNVLGTTTLTRFDRQEGDGIVAYKGSIVDNGDGANLSLNTTFLDDLRWATEIQAVRAGLWGASGLSLSNYLLSKLP